MSKKGIKRKKSIANRGSVPDTRHCLYFFFPYQKEMSGKYMTKVNGEGEHGGGHEGKEGGGRG